MSLLQLIYASRPFGYDDLTLGSILNTARLNNGRDDITGALICREDLYLQLLEGPAARVEALYQRIERDDRHAELVKLRSENVGARMFPDWAMKHDPARSWMWTAAEVSAGAIAKVTPDQALGVFVRLASEPAPVAAAPACPVSN
jgi:Sensors of blue-light using FAD